jgi:hypothetical protein
VPHVKCAESYVTRLFANLIDHKENFVDNLPLGLPLRKWLTIL